MEDSGAEDALDWMHSCALKRAMYYQKDNKAR